MFKWSCGARKKKRDYDRNIFIIIIIIKNHRHIVIIILLLNNCREFTRTKISFQSKMWETDLTSFHIRKQKKKKKKMHHLESIERSVRRFILCSFFFFIEFYDCNPYLIFFFFLETLKLFVPSRRESASKQFLIIRIRWKNSSNYGSSCWMYG